MVAERDGLLGGVRAVAERGLEVDEALASGRFRGLSHDRGAEGVRRDVAFPVVRILVRGGGVHDDVGSEVADERAHQRAVGNGSFHDLESVARSQVVAPTGLEVVDDEHLVAAGEETVGELRADEAAAASDEDLHEGVPRDRGRPARLPDELAFGGSAQHGHGAFLDQRAVLVSAVVEAAVPELEAQQTPELASEGTLVVEVCNHLVGVDERS